MLMVGVVCATCAIPGMPQGKTFFQFTDFHFLQIPVVKVGTEIQVSAMVKNVGPQEGEAYATFYVDGFLVDTKEVALKPGEKQEVIFSVKFTKVGMHKVSIGNLEPQLVKVYESPLDSAVLIIDFDEVQGTVGKEGDLVMDKSGFGNNGIVRGEVTWVDGVIGKGVCTGKTGYIEIPEAPSLDITGDTITMMIWFWPDNEEDYSDFFTKGDWNVLKMQKPTLINFFAGGWGRGECMASVPENWNHNWHHVAGVCDGKTLKLYVDGELVKTLDLEVQGPIGHVDFPWNIGRNAQCPVGRWTYGRLDEARIYLEALSADEIKTIYEMTKPKP